MPPSGLRGVDSDESMPGELVNNPTLSNKVAVELHVR